MGATPQAILPPAQATPVGPWTKYAAPQGQPAQAPQAEQGPWTKYAAPTGNTGGVSGSWQPETLGQKIERYAEAPSEMFKGMAASDEAARQQAIQQEEAKPNASPLHAAVKSLEYGVPAASARIMEGVTTPSSLGLGALATVAPEVAGPIVMAEGANSALKPKQPGELMPDYVERLLGSGAAIAGGAAAAPEEAPKFDAAGRALDTVQEKVSGALARPTLERTLSKTAADAKYGHVPERAIVGEKITTAKDAEARLGDLGKQIDETLNKPENVNKTIDVKKIVMQNARGAIADARRAGNIGAVNRIIQVRDAMLKQYGDLNKSPRAAAAMKSTLYGDVRFTGAEHESEVNAFRKAVASGIRDEVNRAAPEVKQLNQRYGDAAAAKEALERSERLRSNRGMTTRLKEGAVTHGARRVAQLIGKQYEKPGPGLTAERGTEGGIARGGNGAEPRPGMTRTPEPRRPGPGWTQAKPAELPPKPSPQLQAFFGKGKPGEGAAAAGLTTEPPKTIPEQEAQSRTHLVETMKKVLRNPAATAEEKAQATQRLVEMNLR